MVEIKKPFLGSIAVHGAVDLESCTASLAPTHQIMHAHCLPESALNVGVPCLESTFVQDTDREWQLIDTVASC